MPLVPVQVMVDRRVDQGRQLRAIARLGAEQQRHRRCQVAAGAVADDRDAIAGDAELLGAIHRIDEAGEHVLERRREPCLPGEPVVQGEHLDPSRLGKKGAEAVVRLDAADLPAAAVDENCQPRPVGRPAGS